MWPICVKWVEMWSEMWVLKSGSKNHGAMGSVQLARSVGLVAPGMRRPLRMLGLDKIVQEKLALARPPPHRRPVNPWRQGAARRRVGRVEARPPVRPPLQGHARRHDLGRDVAADVAHVARRWQGADDQVAVQVSDGRQEDARCLPPRRSRHCVNSGGRCWHSGPTRFDFWRIFRYLFVPTLRARRQILDTYFCCPQRAPRPHLYLFHIRPGNFPYLHSRRPRTTNIKIVFFWCPRDAWQFKTPICFPAVEQGLILE